VARDWDEHYADPANRNWEAEPLLVEVAELLKPGRALDLACGTGRNALYLASLGWRVTAVDRSRVAIRALRERAGGAAIEARAADLEAGGFAIAADAYDLICDFFYLQRDLFPAIRAGVKPGGVFAGAIHLADASPEARPRNPAFLLSPGELRRQFEGWKVLFYSEAAEAAHRRLAARIVARRA
jgi:tellurite methyltransferase